MGVTERNETGSYRTISKIKDSTRKRRRGGKLEKQQQNEMKDQSNNCFRIAPKVSYYENLEKKIIDLVHCWMCTKKNHMREIPIER